MRISGPAALRLADSLFECKGPRPSQRSANTFVYGQVKQPGTVDADLDEAILLIYRAPASYTCEDVVELQCHGGATATRRVLRAALAAGARTAEPGEFTKRAFLNGRIDLLQAEAVMDMIQARTDRAAASALEQLEGRLSGPFNVVYDTLMTVAADLEATLDFSEEELPDLVFKDVRQRLGEAAMRLRNMLEGWEEGRLLREGARVVLAGAPNVGKSTLLNALVGHERAIVTPVAGTTRDTIEETVVINGFPVCLVDTAGIRESSCDIENEGITRARDWLAKADLTVWLLDATLPLSSQQLPEPGRPVLLLLNKCDLAEPPAADIHNLPFPCVTASVASGQGLGVLHEALVEQLGLLSPAPPHAVIAERHRTLVCSALNKLNACGLLLDHSRPDGVCLAAGDLRDAIEELGTITGRSYSDGLLDSIFSRFCVGK